MLDNVAIKEALLNTGLQINDVWDLVNTLNPYPNSILTLIDLLKQGVSDDRTKEGIIRALALKEAKGKANKVIIEEYQKTAVEKSSLRWAMGNTISVIICEDDIQAVLDIVRNKQNGISRQMFVMALGKIKTEVIENTLISLLDDDEVAPHAINSLGRIKSKKAYEKIHLLLSHPKPLIKKNAKKALTKIKPY